MSNSYTFVWQVTNVSLRLTSATVVNGQGTVTVNTAPGPGTYDNSQINGTGQYPVVITDRPFYADDYLISITMNNVTFMDSNQNFSACYRLQTVNMPICTNIPSDCFSGCSALTTVNMPLVTSINYAAFYNSSPPNSSLTTLNFPNLTTITGGSDNVTYVFRNLSQLSSINLGNLNSISSGYIFRQCNTLQKVTFPSTLASLPTLTFVDCAALNTVVAPAVTALSTNTFQSCPALTTVYFGSSAPSGSGSFNGVNGSFKVYRNINVSTGWGSTYQTYQVVAISPVTSVTPPTTSVSSSGAITLSNTQGATSYQWNRNGTPIGGATTASYTFVPQTDLNQNITLTAFDVIGNSSTSLPSILTKYVSGKSLVSYKIV